MTIAPFLALVVIAILACNEENLVQIGMYADRLKVDPRALLIVMLMLYTFLFSPIDCAMRGAGIGK